MTLDYDLIIRECDKHLSELEGELKLDKFYNSFGADKSSLRSMLSQFFIQDLKLNIFDRLDMIPVRAFQEEDYLPSTIKLPNNIKALAGYGFFRSKNVKVLIIPEGITTIPDYFLYGSNIEKVILPSTLQAISSTAFEGCDKLDELVFPEAIQENIDKIMPFLKWTTDEDGDACIDDSDPLSAFYANVISGE